MDPTTEMGEGEKGRGERREGEREKKRKERKGIFWVFETRIYTLPVFSNKVSFLHKLIRVSDILAIIT